MEDDLKKNGRRPKKKMKMEDDLIFFWKTRITTLKKWKTTLKKMEDNLKKNKMEDDLKKWKTNQSTKINLIGCDTIVNSPSLVQNQN